LHLQKIETAHEVLKKYISDELKIKIFSEIDKGYKIVEKILNDNEWTNSALTENIKTQLCSFVVEFMFERAIKLGLIKDLKCEIAFNPKRTHRHLKLATLDDRFIFTISQVKNKNDIPRKSEFRLNYSYTNQLSFDDISGINRVQKQGYLIITHGYFREGLKFINVGMPSSDLKSWIAKFSLLEDPHILKELEKSKYTVEEISDDLILEVKQEFKKRVLEDDKA